MTDELLDYITGDPVGNTPEEQVVQAMVAQLVEDYGYPATHLRTRPQWRTRKNPSDTRKTYPLDIAVFGVDQCREEATKKPCQVEASDSQLFMVVETKRDTVKEGMEQLKIYLNLCDAEVGVWFNGKERRVIRKVVKNGRNAYEDLPDIPRHNERIEDVGLYRRKDLKPTHNLKLVFRTIRNYLAGNATGATRDEVLAEQLIALIFCKIYDERFTAPDDPVTFRAGTGEDPSQVHVRVLQLFDRVRSKYPEVFGPDDQITLDPASVAHVVGALQGFSLTETDRDAVADAFEIFIGYALKGAQGQFFTPRNVVKLMVAATNLGPDDVVIDPACGSGGFLTESLRQMWAAIDKQAKQLNWPDPDRDEEKRAAAVRCIRGIEKDALLAKVAKSYMAILGDGKGGIYANEDSLADPQSWNPSTRQGAALGTFDVVLANPPFGKDIKVTEQDKLAQYELGHEWKKDQQTGTFVKTTKLPKKGRTVEALFVERCIQLLKKGGRLGIILPESYFFAPTRRYVAQFLERHNITHLIDLPHNTFRPHNNAKCVAVILEKDVPQQAFITMVAAEEMGHDHGGRTLYRTDPKTGEITDQVWDDISAAVDELTGKIPAKKRRFVFEVPAKEVRKAQVYVPRYYWDLEKEQELRDRAKAQGAELVSVQDLIDQKIIATFAGHGSPEARFKGTGDIPYVRVADIVSWQVYLNPTALIPDHVAEIYRRDDKRLEALDLLYVSRGSYRIGSVALLAQEDTDVILTREIQVVRVAAGPNKYDIDPYYLLYLFSTEIVATQTKNKVLIDTTLPNIGERWKELLLPIHTDPAERVKARDEVKRIIRATHKARTGIGELRTKRGLVLM